MANSSWGIEVDKKFLLVKRPFIFRLSLGWGYINLFLFAGWTGISGFYNIPHYLLPDALLMSGYSIFWHPQEIKEGQNINCIESRIFEYPMSKRMLYEDNL